MGWQEIRPGPGCLHRGTTGRSARGRCA